LGSTALREDDGKDVMMLNAIRLYDNPRKIPGVQPDETSREVLNRYNRFVMPYLLKRGGYPIMAGRAAADSVEVWGLENAEKWTMGAIVRYRSRRDMMEMVNNPEFKKVHKFKYAAMEKTIAFPMTPILVAGGLGKIVSLLLFSLASFSHLIICIFRIRKISRN